jgi:methylisocitrate lyase
VDAGADMIFPEALQTTEEFDAFPGGDRRAVVGQRERVAKSPLFDATALENLGFNVVIWPVTTLRVSMGAVEDALSELAGTGTQASFVERMQTRSRLYELIGYEA